MGDRKIHLLRETWSHMAAVSGFDPLFACLQARLGSSAVSHHVPCTISHPGLVRNVLSKLRKHFAPQLRQEISPFVESRQAKIAAECVAILNQNPDDILLLSAGENQFASVIANASAEIRKRIYVCLHQPPAWFRLHWRNRSALSGLGGIFALCGEQARFLSEYCSSPVHEIRHGVCLDFFQPAADSSAAGDSPRFLFVGQWLRDFSTLAATISIVLKHCPEARFDLVIPNATRQQECLYPIARLAEVEWHAGISPEALRALYQNAYALLLPLIDSTANNAIIEAMACGIPVITSDVGGVRDYLPETAALFCPLSDATAHAMAAVQLIANPEKAHSMRMIARTYAEEQYSWERIAKQMEQIIAVS